MTRQTIKQPTDRQTDRFSKNSISQVCFIKYSLECHLINFILKLDLPLNDQLVLEINVPFLKSLVLYLQYTYMYLISRREKNEAA